MFTGVNFSTRAAVCSVFLPFFFLSATTEAGAEVADVLVGADLPAWRRETMGVWATAGSITLDPQEPGFLVPAGGTGVMYNGRRGRTANILSKKEYGDVAAHIEFLVGKGQNSGVYFMGRYEIQILDSWDHEEDRPRENPRSSDCGGIYQRYDRTRPKEKRGFEGRPPLVNACRRPGEWQTLDVLFRAPRFDANGKRTEKARFVKVFHNGVLVHDNVEVGGPTRAHVPDLATEAASGPLMLQGDHGAVAYRNIHLRALEDAATEPGDFPREVFDDSGFTTIFDGQSLEGWHVSAKTGHSRTSDHQSGGRWVIEEGAMVGSQDVPGNGGIIITDDSYGDFEVVVEMRNDYGPDSGLFLRSTEDGKAYQYLVDYHDRGNLAGLYGEGIRPGFHLRNFTFAQEPEQIQEVEAPYRLPVSPQAWPRFWKDGHWNELRARIVGNPPTITTWINGVRFMEWTDPQRRHPDRGGIALQVHGGGDWTKHFVRYRGVRVKRL